ncbi:MAG TPA: TOBE domain-containing protein [Casimicrobiaceae bacterium]|nr:TOBE domain-containing protein [Casimicrobiaceae bacterium]
MKTSARNHFSGKVKDLVKGPVTTEVTIAVAGGVDVVATISTRSAESLGLAVGKPAHALIKASSVVVGID